MVNKPQNKIKPGGYIDKASQVGFIPVKNGYYTMVDLEDYPKYAIHTWRFSQSGHVCRRNGKHNKPSTVFLHRLINNTPEGMVTDHINFDKLDNRKQNLRSVTYSFNRHHIRKCSPTSYSGIRGITYSPQSKTWVVRKIVNGICFRKYGCKTIGEAYMVYNRMIKNLIKNGMLPKELISNVKGGRYD
jgi:hypothetical protein